MIDCVLSLLIVKYEKTIVRMTEEIQYILTPVARTFFAYHKLWSVGMQLSPLDVFYKNMTYIILHVYAVVDILYFRRESNRNPEKNDVISHIHVCPAFAYICFKFQNNDWLFGDILVGVFFPFFKTRTYRAVLTFGSLEL